MKGNDKPSRSKTLFLFILPFLIAIVYISMIFIIFGKEIGYVIGGAMLLTTFILGPEISITATFVALATIKGEIVWTSTGYMLLIAISIAFVDVIGAFFLLWNYDLLKKVPWLGPWMDRTEKSNRSAIKASSWRQRFSLVGISIYVMFPVHGSGGLVGTLIGRILGLNKWKVFAAVSVGATIGALWIAILVQRVGEGITDFFEGNLFQLIAVVVTIVIAALVIWFILKNRKKKNEKRRKNKK